MIQPLPLSEYRASYEPGQVMCTTTDMLKPTEEIIGQDRAQKALRFLKKAHFHEKSFVFLTQGKL